MDRKDKPREKAVEILCRVEEGAFADVLLEDARRSFEARDNAFILELVYGILRQRSHLDWVLDRFSAQPVSKTDQWTRNVLRLAAYQILVLTKVPVSAAVNTAVDLAKHKGGKSSYVNGLLRNLDRKRNSITDPDPGNPLTRLAILFSHPEWIVARWASRFGPEKTETLLRENNHPSPLVIRINSLKTTREELKFSLESEGAAVRETKYSPAGLELISSPGILNLTSFQKGWFMIQDEAAQLIGLIVDPRPGETVLDACAAPGGKAAHLAELMENKGSIIALEKDPGRIGKIGRNSDRLGITIIKPVLGDAETWKEGLYDKILVDAPCSGLGVLRRHPDGRWNKTREIVRKRSMVQRRIIDNCSSLVKPGGILVYATCTTEPEENEVIISGFLKSSAGNDFTQADSRSNLPPEALNLVDKQGFFRTFPDEPAMDGFFGAKLMRKR